MSHCTRNSHCSESAIRRSIFDFLVWNLWQHVGFSPGYVKNTPRSGMCERCCIDIMAKRGICDLWSQNPVGRFVLWCKITVTVREFFEINCLKITVTFSVFNCFGINTVIFCCFTVRVPGQELSRGPQKLVKNGVFFTGRQSTLDRDAKQFLQFVYLLRLPVAQKWPNPLFL